MKVFQKILMILGVGLGMIQVANAAQVPGQGTAIPGYTLKPVTLNVQKLVENDLQSLRDQENQQERLSKVMNLQEPTAIGHTFVKLQDDLEVLKNYAIKINELKKLLAQKNYEELYKQITELAMNVKQAHMFLPLLSAMNQLTPAQRAMALKEMQQTINQLGIRAVALAPTKLTDAIEKVYPALQGLLAKLLEAKYTLLIEQDAQKVQGIIKQLDADFKKLRDAKIDTLVVSVSKLRPADLEVVTQKVDVLK